MTTTSSHPRLNNEVFLGSAHAVDIEALLARLEATGVQCVIDLRSTQSQAEISPLELGARSRRMHYAHLPRLSISERQNRSQPSRELAWAARTALRYRTCLLTQGLAREQEDAEEIAKLVGLRVVGLFSQRDASGASE
jgi:hypothetical protein